MTLLWPELGRKAASNNLRVVLHAARKVLDPATGPLYLASEDESLVLSPGGQLWVDAVAFAEFAFSARRSRNPAAYRAAIELYAGELLPDDRYEAWAEDGRGQPGRLTSSCWSSWPDCSKNAESTGRLRDLTEGLIGRTHQRGGTAGLMRLHALSGRQGRVVARYERLRETLAKTAWYGARCNDPSLAQQDSSRESPARPSPTGEPSHAGKPILRQGRNSLGANAR